MAFQTFLSLATSKNIDKFNLMANLWGWFDFIALITIKLECQSICFSTNLTVIECGFKI
jgi:hypothetical protein